MDWYAQIDRYCERTDPGFWSEPLNAGSNLAFLIAAAVVWAMLGGRQDAGARLLTVILAVIGVGSFLFHTYATAWAGVADVVPILVFILVYLYLATLRFFDAPPWAGMLAVVLFFPFSYLVGAAVRAGFGPLNGSVAYAPVPVLVLLYAAALAPRAPWTARGLALGSALLIVSLAFRTADAAVCAAFPLGTHFLWHTLNGIMLGWMILVLHRHRPPAVRPRRAAGLAPPPGGR